MIWSANEDIGDWTTGAPPRKEDPGPHVPTKTRGSSLIAHYDYPEAARLLRENRPSDRLLQLLGAAHSYRCLTTAQLAALSGDPTLASSATDALRLAHCSGILETRRDTLARTRWAPGNTQVRVTNAKGHFARLVKPHLTWPELYWVTGAQTWLHGLGHDRHDLITSELLLRGAEYLPVIGVMGERLAGYRQLMGIKRRGRRPPTASRADGALIRGDGLRICIEVTATKGKTLANKIRRIVAMLDRTRLSQNGVVVVFIVVPPANRMERQKNPLRSYVCRRIIKALELPGTRNPHAVAERIAVVSVREWFPGPHQVHTDNFFCLRAWRPLHFHVQGVAAWEPVDLLDSTQVSFWPESRFDPRTLATDLAHLAQTPHWLRDSQAHLPRWLDLLASPLARPLLPVFDDLLESVDPPPLVGTSGRVRSVTIPHRLADRGRVLADTTAEQTFQQTLAKRRNPWWPQSPDPLLLVELKFGWSWESGYQSVAPPRVSPLLNPRPLRLPQTDLPTQSRALEDPLWAVRHLLEARPHNDAVLNKRTVAVCEVLADLYDLSLTRIHPDARHAVEDAIRTGRDPLAAWNRYHPLAAKRYSDLRRGVNQGRALLLLNPEPVVDLHLDLEPQRDATRVRDYLMRQQLGLGEWLYEAYCANDPDLNSIELARVLAEAPVTATAADRIVKGLVARAKPDQAPPVVSVGWVLDRRTHGRRLLCLLDAIRASRPAQFSSARLRSNPPPLRQT